MAKKKKDSRTVSYHALAFVDLLGQQERLRSLRVLPDQTDSEAMEELKHTLANTYEVVTGFRDNFNSFVSTIQSRRKRTEYVPKGKLKEARALKGKPVRVKQFSDFTVAFTSLLPTSDAIAPMSSVYTLFGALAQSSLVCLSNGHPIRGGIDIGWGINIKYDEVYGGALAKAYALESHVAHYPRIVIGEQLMNFLNGWSNSEKDSIPAKFSKALAQNCIDLIALDDDGIPFIDFAGESMAKMFKDENGNIDPGRDVVSLAYQFVMDASARYQKEQNSKLAFKYAPLRHYLESRLYLWDISIQD